MEANKDVNGKESSKRVIAFRFLNLALIMAIVYFLVVVYHGFRGTTLNVSFPFEMWYGLLALGGGAVGLTIFEKKVK